MPASRTAKMAVLQKSRAFQQSQMSSK